jgi:hypothetical protein
MKRILLVAVIALCGIAAQAQNKIFEKYAKMEGVEYVCINKSLISSGLSFLAGGGQVTYDSLAVNGTDLGEFANFNRMLIITAKGDKKHTLYDDMMRLTKQKDYEILIESHSADNDDAVIFSNTKFDPNEFIICNLGTQDHEPACFVVVLLKDK